MKQDKDRVENEIIQKTLTRIVEKFKLETLDVAWLKMVRKAVHEALKGFTAHDVVLGYRFSQSYCEKCGECCRRCDPITVDMEDLTNIAAFLGVSVNLVVSNYTKVLKDGRLSLKTNPCPFLSSNECSIYPARPSICRLFPLQYENGRLIPKIFTYCAFCKNLIADKAFHYVVLDILREAKPELYKKIKQETEKLQLEMPEDWIGQIKFIDKLIVPTKKKADGR